MIEIVLTSFLMFIIMCVATDTRSAGQVSGLAIGSAVAFGSLFGGPISGSSMNPARTLGPALVSGEASHIWLYLVGPTIGAIIGALAYQVVSFAAMMSTQPKMERRAAANDHRLK